MPERAGHVQAVRYRRWSTMSCPPSPAVALFGLPARRDLSRRESHRWKLQDSSASGIRAAFATCQGLRRHCALLSAADPQAGQGARWPPHVPGSSRKPGTKLWAL